MVLEISTPELLVQLPRGADAASPGLHPENCIRKTFSSGLFIKIKGSLHQKMPITGVLGNIAFLQSHLNTGRRWLVFLEIVLH